MAINDVVSGVGGGLIGLAAASLFAPYVAAAYLAPAAYYGLSTLAGSAIGFGAYSGKSGGSGHH